MLSVCALGAAATAAAPPIPAPARHSVVHVIVDDLRPELGAYGLPDRHTPTIDALAASGTVFDRAYAQQAVCGPSRNSFLSGRYPDASRSWNFINSFREDHPEWTSLPGLFVGVAPDGSGRGTLSLGAGKVYHPMVPPDYDGERSWSPMALPFSNPCFNTAATANASCRPKAALAAAAGVSAGAGGIEPPCDGGLPCVFCPIDVKAQMKLANTTVANEFCELDAKEDTETVTAAIGLLRRAAAARSFFYLAVGLHSEPCTSLLCPCPYESVIDASGLRTEPHMPWQAAAEDWAKHPLSAVDLPAHQQPPEGMPPIAFHMSESCPSCVPPIHPTPFVPLAPESVRKARRAYRAATTGMDRKLGVLMDELESLKLRQQTAVVLHGDHGWHLGERECSGPSRLFAKQRLIATLRLRRLLVAKQTERGESSRTGSCKGFLSASSGL